MSKLTMRQLHVLEDMAEDRATGRWGWGSSHTNPTGSALEKRGLARYEYDRSKAYTWGRWYITDAGREFIARG